MTMQKLRVIWNAVFNNVPSDEMLDHISLYIATDHNPADAERIIFWLGMKSSCLSFADENARALWITKEVKRHAEGGALPGLTETPTL
jgi:hypothetical protein